MGSPIAGDIDSIRQGYEEVRDDDSDTNWLVCKYEGKSIVLDSIGVEYDEFLGKFGDEDRAYGYVRIEVGDEMSKRSKFALVTWIGHSVSPLKKAKVSCDKAFVKEVMLQFSKEILADDIAELQHGKVKSLVEKADGADYGTANLF